MDHGDALSGIAPRLDRFRLLAAADAAASCCSRLEPTSSRKPPGGPGRDLRRSGVDRTLGACLNRGVLVHVILCTSVGTRP
jgi:hypothetical protein